jgi:23S rRNA pseudouridine1911/1915/1917 synthase
MKENITVPEENGVVRVDKFLAAKFPEYSRAAIVKLFDLKLIKLDGKPIQPGFRLKPGATIEYDLGPLSEKPEVVDLPIIYEDENVVVINKPVGIISHARGKFWQEASVASFIREHVAKNNFDKEDLRAGIVHRLDRATSGVMICAKNQDTLRFLQKQFSDRSVTKTYQAIVKGTVEPDSAIIDAAIERNAKDPKRFMVSKSGKAAQTEYTVISNYSGYTQLELKPRTGRTHQLRIHLDYINHPIVGDELYGGEENKRLMLHAHKLRITLPNAENKEFIAPLPKEFKELIG